MSEEPVSPETAALLASLEPPKKDFKRKNWGGRTRGVRNGEGKSFALLDKRSYKKDLKRMALSWTGRFKYDDIDNLPPVEIDLDGYPIRPRPITHKTRVNMGENQRKIRFLLMYNFSGGNIALACMEAGCTYKVYEDWCRDEKFRERLKDMNRDIGERLHIRLAQRSGLMRQPKGGLKINDSILTGMMRKFKPDYFTGGAPEPPKPEPVHESNESQVPRPDAGPV